MPRGEPAQLSPRERRTAAKVSHALDDGRPLLSLDQAAVYLDISKRTLQRMIAAGEIRSFRVRDSVKIRPSDIDAYLSERVS